MEYHEEGLDFLVKLIWGGEIYSQDGNKLTEMECPTLGPWFGKFMRDSKLMIRVIKDKTLG